MRQWTRTTLLWYGAGLLCYVLGMGVFLVVAADLFLTSEDWTAGASTAHLALLAVSVGLLVVGRVLVWKAGGDAAGVAGVPGRSGPKRERSTLERLGYRVPSDPPEEAEEGFVYEDGTGYLVCRECGARNELGFDYCRNCSAELPE